MRFSLYRKRHPPVGARPGTLFIPADSPPPEIEIIRYDEKDVTVISPAAIGDLRAHEGPGVTWINIEGIDETLLRRMAELFAIHPLALEDVAHSPQRPKAEDYPAHLLLITRMVSLTKELELDIEQVAIFVGPNYVLSFGERPGDVLDPVRQRIKEGKGAIRTAGAGYLGYAILDTIVDEYYPVMERINDRLESLEIEVLENPSERTVDHLNRVKTDLVILRRGIGPQLETLNRLMRDKNKWLGEDTMIYLRDTTDHAAQLVDVIDSHRELVNSLLNTYLSIVANRTNEVMKVLTIMSAIFIPLTFMAGIYGMNFDHMPELHSWWAYPILLAVMGAIALTMVIWFRRRGWLGGSRSDDES